MPFCTDIGERSKGGNIEYTQLHFSRIKPPLQLISSLFRQQVRFLSLSSGERGKSAFHPLSAPQSTQRGIVAVERGGENMLLKLIKIQVGGQNLRQDRWGSPLLFFPNQSNPPNSGKLSVDRISILFSSSLFICGEAQTMEQSMLLLGGNYFDFRYFQETEILIK